MEFATLYQKVLDSGNTELLNTINLELDRQLRALSDPELWELYTLRYPDAEVTFLTSAEDIESTFAGVSADDLIECIRAFDLDFREDFYITNPDVMGDIFGEEAMFTVSNIAEILTDDAVLDYLIDTEEFYWVDTDTEEMRLLIEEAEIETRGSFVREMESKIADLNRQIAELESQLRANYK